MQNNTDILKLIEIINNKVNLIGDNSNLILDPDLDSYYLMDVSLLAIPNYLQTSFEIEKTIMDTKNKNSIFLALNHYKLKTLLERIIISINKAITEDLKYYDKLESLQTNSLQ